MTIKQVIFTSRVQAESQRGWNTWAVISITDPGAEPASLKQGWRDILRLEFDDVDRPVEPWVLFTEAEARRIVEFVEQVEGRGIEGVLVHCRLGISRSAAVAKWIAERYKLPFDHEYDHYNLLVYRVLKGMEL